MSTTIIINVYTAGRGGVEARVSDSNPGLNIRAAVLAFRQVRSHHSAPVQINEYLTLNNDGRLCTKIFSLELLRGWMFSQKSRDVIRLNRSARE